MEMMAYNLEFRGLVAKETKTGETVYNVSLEDEFNEQIQLYAGKDVVKFSKVKKGDKIDLHLDYNTTYKNLHILGVVTDGRERL